MILNYGVHAAPPGMPMRSVFMLRYLLWGIFMLLLTACSEMQVIGKAAMRELRADGMSTERLAYRTARN
jgi:hypothetical protein